MFTKAPPSEMRTVLPIESGGRFFYGAPRGCSPARMARASIADAKEKGGRRGSLAARKSDRDLAEKGRIAKNR